MTSPADRPPPEELQRRCAREIRRFHAREAGLGSFWRSLGVLGAIGWPIALLAAGGAWAGRWLDGRWQTGTRLTLFCVFLGAVAGGAVAWSVVEGTRKRKP